MTENVQVLGKAIRNIYAFNQHNRDLWVHNEAKKIPAGARVLDVGAGPCRYKGYFSHCDYKAHDFCLTPEQSYGNLDYISDITNISVPNGSFDAILCTEVLEHVVNPADAIKEIQRILKPGGKLLLSAPLGSWLHQEPIHYYGGFTPYWYREVLGSSGFINVNIDKNGGFFRFFGQETLRFVNKLKTINLFLYGLFYPFRIFLPLICYWADIKDPEDQFTVGYHVSAILSPNLDMDRTL